MKKFKKYSPLLALFLILSAILSTGIKAYKIESSGESEIADHQLDTSRFENVSIHRFCFVQAGYVDIRNVLIRGFWFAYYTPFFCCIGDVDLDLKCFFFGHDEPRLIVSSLLGKTIYENNISVSLKGFFGSVRPTGSVDPGHLKGFTRIVYITALDN